MGRTARANQTLEPAPEFHDWEWARVYLNGVHFDGYVAHRPGWIIVAVPRGEGEATCEVVTEQ